jgi:hypothetical protein
MSSLLCKLIGICPESYFGSCPTWLLGIESYWLVFIIGLLTGYLIKKYVRF